MNIITIELDKILLEANVFHQLLYRAASHQQGSIWPFHSLYLPNIQRTPQVGFFAFTYLNV